MKKTFIKLKQGPRWHTCPRVKIKGGGMDFQNRWGAPFLSFEYDYK